MRLQTNVPDEPTTPPGPTPGRPKTPPAPPTPTDEPSPQPVDDPPSEAEPKPPYTVSQSIGECLPRSIPQELWRSPQRAPDLGLCSRFAGTTTSGSRTQRQDPRSLSKIQ